MPHNSESSRGRSSWWVLGLIAVAVIGGSLVMDLRRAKSNRGTDTWVARWSMEGLRIYLLARGAALASPQSWATLGGHIISVGFVVSLAGRPRPLGSASPRPVHPKSAAVRAGIYFRRSRFGSRRAIADDRSFYSMRARYMRLV